MDRFLDSADPEKKERSKAIHAALSACRDRIHLLTTGTVNASAFAVIYRALTGRVGL